MDLNAARRAAPAPASTVDISRLGTDAGERVKALREYAARVFGKDITASAWLGRPHRAVLDGTCSVLEAALSPQGFVDAMLELGRIEAGVVDSPWRPRAQP